MSKQEKPYTEQEVLDALSSDRVRSAGWIAMLLDCDLDTVYLWLDKLEKSKKILRVEITEGKSGWIKL